VEDVSLPATSIGPFAAVSTFPLLDPNQNPLRAASP
jgi:hypothetical protein